MVVYRHLPLGPCVMQARISCISQAARHETRKSTQNNEAEEYKGFLVAEWLGQASQGHEMYCHDLEVMGSNPGWV